MTLNFFFGILCLVGAVGFLWGAIAAKRSGNKGSFEMQLVAGLLFLISAIVKMWP